MISAFDIYLVMQLDSLGTLFAVVGCLGTLVGGIGAIAHRIASAYTDDDEAQTFARAVAVAPKLLIFGAACLFVNTALPSSKTAAAMIVLPALTSDSVMEAVTPEAKELYDLAKDAMRTIAKPPAAEEVESGT